MNLLYSILQSQGDKVKKKRLNRSMWRCPPQYYKHRTVQMLQKKTSSVLSSSPSSSFFFVCFFWGWLKNTMLQKPKGKAAFTTVNNTKKIIKMVNGRFSRHLALVVGLVLPSPGCGEDRGETAGSGGGGTSCFTALTHLPLHHHLPGNTGDLTIGHHT